jgi:hypothetical protein
MSTNKIEIEMKNGSKKKLSELTDKDLEQVKLTLKKDKETGELLPNLTMKAEVIRSTETHDIERRLFKWTTMPSLKMYDLPVPKNYDIWTKETTKEQRYDLGIANWKIEQDKVHCGITSGKPLDQKIIASAEKLGMSKADVDKIKAIMKQAGFGK